MNNPSMHLPRRGGGMQVHAVPENERAIDPLTGKRLPWSYDYADPDKAAQRRVPEERGPFGRSTNRRGASRSKTFTPVGVKPQDKDALENQRVIDDIFTRAKESTNGQRNAAAGQQQGGDAQGAAGAAGQTADIVTPTEVVLYGFPEAFQYAAIEFYERVSGGAILEDYERFPPHTRYNLTLSRNVPLRPAALPAGALRMVNNYHGGEHWIKVTFSSADAADRACYYSPHTVQGYAIFAERYRGVPPARDEPIPATPESLASIAGSPSQGSSTTAQPTAVGRASSSTATSQTANGGVARPRTPEPITVGSNSTSSSALPPRPKTPLIRGASRAVLRPAETALLPASSRWQRTFGTLPLASFFVAGSGGERIVSEVPVKADGTFDWEGASLYWLFWALLDYYFWFCDFLGLKGED